MKDHPAPRSSRHPGAFTLMELLIVVAIIGILMAAAFPAYNRLIQLAWETASITGLKDLSNATNTWAAERGGKLPSPKYSANDPNLPPNWKLDTDGEEGLWLNGVVYAQIYIENAHDEPESGKTNQASGGRASNFAQSGKHLVGTVFESRVSTKRQPTETDWYRHSYAMNANLQYDELALLTNAPDPWLTEKVASKFEPVTAMLYIDCIDSNIVMASDRGLVMDAAAQRYEGKKVLASFLDGHVEKLRPNDVPEGDPDSDQEASLFWRGVAPKR